jgi:hypothetical protein
MRKKLQQYNNNNPGMVVKKFKLNGQTQAYEFLREIKDIDQNTVLETMVTDLPFEMGKQLYVYEAGQMIGDRFIEQYVWHSENPNLFD